MKLFDLTKYVLKTWFKDELCAIYWYLSALCCCSLWYFLGNCLGGCLGGYLGGCLGSCLACYLSSCLSSCISGCSDCCLSKCLDGCLGGCLGSYLHSSFDGYLTNWLGGYLSSCLVFFTVAYYLLRCCKADLYLCFLVYVFYSRSGPDFGLVIFWPLVD